MSTMEQDLLDLQRLWLESALIAERNPVACAHVQASVLRVCAAQLQHVRHEHFGTATPAHTEPRED